jgi:thiamine-phosphate pyrophosphorylase
VLAQLFAAGLMHYHLRKPDWSRAELTAWLNAVPTSLHPRIVLHSHHELAADFAVAGLHDRDTHAIETNPLGYFSGGVFRSRAVHDLAALTTAMGCYDRVLFSPIFPSFSKTGYALSPAITHAEIRATLARPRRAEVIALGGIDASRISACAALGFDGIALLGAVWQAPDPLQVFKQTQNSLLAYAA